MEVLKLSELDYKHWCEQVGRLNVRVYKDTIEYDEAGTTVIIYKQNLKPSPVQIDVRN